MPRCHNAQRNSDPLGSYDSGFVLQTGRSLMSRCHNALRTLNPFGSYDSGFVTPLCLLLSSWTSDLLSGMLMWCFLLCSIWLSDATSSFEKATFWKDFLWSRSMNGAYGTALLVQYAVYSTGGSRRALVQISAYAELLEKISVARYSTLCIKTA